MYLGDSRGEGFGSVRYPGLAARGVGKVRVQKAPTRLGVAQYVPEFGTVEPTKNITIRHEHDVIGFVAIQRVPIALAIVEDERPEQHRVHDRRCESAVWCHVVSDLGNRDGRETQVCQLGSWVDARDAFTVSVDFGVRILYSPSLPWCAGDS